MSRHYFAYGSNLKASRMRERVPGVACTGVARLEGFRLTVDKRGADGSGKANLRADPDARVWGVVYELDPRHWQTLDGFEPDYTRFEVTVEVAGRHLGVQTYLSERFARHPVCFDWYKRLIVEGARERGLPDRWQRQLQQLPARNDPRDPTR